MESELYEADFYAWANEQASLLRAGRLKWRHQPALRGNSWRLSIANARDQLDDHLADNPSLQSRLPDAVASAYRYARRDASVQTGLPLEAFPAVCPWTETEMMAAAFWPD